MAMTEVRLHGALGKQFGASWNLDVSSPADAIRALGVLCKGFRESIERLDKNNYVFVIRTKNHTYGEEDLSLTLGHNKVLHIAPIVRGNSAGVRFVIGAILVIVGYAASGYTGGASLNLVPVGLSLMGGAIVEWLTPKPNNNRDENAQKQSWGLSGALATTDQGAPVPLIYGEVLVAGKPISAGITADNVVNSGQAGAAIGGNLVQSLRVSDAAWGSPLTAEFVLNAQPQNMAPPITATWSHSGFVGCTVTRTDSGLMTRLKVTYTPVGEIYYFEIPGTVSVTLNGRDARQADEPVIGTGTANLKVTFSA